MTTEKRANPITRYLPPLGLDPQLLSDSAAVLVLLAAGAALSFAVQILLARLLGPEQFGIYSLVMSWVLMVSLFVSLGLDSTIMRFVPAYAALQQFGAMRGLIRRTHQIVLAASIIAAIGMIGATSLLTRSLSGPFWIGAVLLPFFALLQLNSKMILSLRCPVYGVAIGSVLRNFLLLALVCAIGLGLRLAQDASASLGLVCTSAIITAAASYCLMPKLLPRAVRTSNVEYRTREWVGVALPLMAVTAAEQILSRGDIIVLGAFRSKSEVGLYGAAISLATGLDMIMTATNSVVAPVFAELHARREFAELQRWLTRSAGVACTGVMPLGLIFTFLGGYILHLFGERFTGAASALSLLAMACLVRGFTGPVGLLLSMTGHHLLFAKALAITVVATIALDFILIPRYGQIGAASATLLGVALRSLMLGVIVAVKVGTMPTVLAPVLTRVVGVLPRRRVLTSG